MDIEHMDRATIVERLLANEADLAYRRRARTIIAWLDPQKTDRVLDAGCGRGFYLDFVRQISQAELYGVDVDGQALALGQHALSHAGSRVDLGDGGDSTALLNSTIEDLPFADGFFDKIFCSEVLEHVADDRVALRSVGRVLGKGGLLAITVPNANYPFWWDPINKTLEHVGASPIRRGLLAGIWANHVRLYQEADLHRVIEQSGLEIVAACRQTHYCFPFSHNLLYGLGKTLFDADVLPANFATLVDRHNVSGNRGGKLHPFHLGLRLLERFDRANSWDGPTGHSTVNLCVLARKP